MKLIITEKPSVARDIAGVWGIKTRRDGFLEGKGCAITWAFGHLVTLQDFSDYDAAMKRWSTDRLPFIPEQFQLKLIQNKGVKEQFETIKRLLGEADEVICATDAGREGELIFRYLLSLAGMEQKPFRRLWLSSMTNDAIREAFGTLKDGHEYDKLYAAARCRSESDWIVGLNATRCYTVRHGRAGGGDNVLWSVGRVQTPVLAMIVQRDDEIMNFTPEPFWELLTRYREVDFKYTGDRFSAPEAAQLLVHKIEGQPFEITDSKGSKKREKPPQLYDLTMLQRDMNKWNSLSAAQTLQLAQQLYEGKLLTYPRTDSRYLSADMKPKVAATLEQLRSLRPEDIGRLNLEKLPFSKRIMDDKKVTDHHAIIPTGQLPPHGLSGAAREVYDAVVRQFIAAFYPDCVKAVTTVDGVSCEVPFRVTGTVIVKPGWTLLYPRKKSNKTDDEQELPAFVVGESGPHTPQLREGKTKPPRYFSENSLLAAMESAGKWVDDESLREALKERGIGTPATRAAIIETLLKRNYICREKKQLRATDMGRFLISIIGDDLLKSPEMTGEWEEKFKKIERGEVEAADFMEQISAYTRQLIAGTISFKLDQTRWGACPLCGAEVVAGRTDLGCSRWRDGCSFILRRQYKGVTLTERQLQELLQRGVLLAPLNLPEEGLRVLRLTHKGDVMDLACPSRDRQQKK